jgi:[ribosomal protein S18]-alanine N-acetyltransferase
MMNETTKKINIRPIKQTDVPFLWEILYLCIYIPEGITPPAKDEILNHPDIAKYVKDWGTQGDQGLIAVDTQTGLSIGSAWLRLFDSHNKGYGYVNDITPELSIAIVPEYRNQGIGTQLLMRLLEAAKISGYSSISLSVDPHNPAVRLYQKLGFKKIGISGTSWTMKLDLKQ